MKEKGVAAAAPFLRPLEKKQPFVIQCNLKKCESRKT
jgi:hypothetical protein